MQLLQPLESSNVWAQALHSCYHMVMTSLKLKCVRLDRCGSSAGCMHFQVMSGMLLLTWKSSRCCRPTGPPCADIDAADCPDCPAAPHAGITRADCEICPAAACAGMTCADPATCPAVSCAGMASAAAAGCPVLPGAVLRVLHGASSTRQQVIEQILRELQLCRTPCRLRSVLGPRWTWQDPKVHHPL